MKMRKLTNHLVPGIDEKVEILVLDDADRKYGSAPHQYRVDINCVPCAHINFQEGPVKEVGANGVTAESLIAICIDRLERYQAGKYACVENQKALDGLRSALNAMQSRTENRVKRGVEGRMAQ